MNHKHLYALFLIFVLLAPAAGTPEAGIPVANAAAPLADVQYKNNAMVDVWVFVDADQNGYYSSGDHGLTDALACVYHGKMASCVGTDEGDTWWEDLREIGGYSTWVDPATAQGYPLRSIRCQETGSSAEYKGCRYNLQDWKVNYTLGGGKRINIFYALAAP